MTTFGDQVKQFGGTPIDSALGGVALAGGKWYFCDPTHGTANADGLSPETANSSLLTMYNLLRDGYNDGVVLMGGATAYKPTAAFVWSKNYAHLVGANDGLSGMGQRSRIVNDAANDLAILFTLSGSGCLMKNIQFFDGKDSAADGACVLVSGSRNHFVGCFVAGMGDATASGPQTRAGSYSLKVTGDENQFSDCVVGLDTVVRSAANAELIVTGARNRFIGCEFRSNSVTSTKNLVAIDSTGGDMRTVRFDDCLFHNYSTNYATGITDAFKMTVVNTVYVLLDANCRLSGIGMGWADSVTRIYGVGPVPNAGFGISIVPTT